MILILMNLIWIARKQSKNFILGYIINWCSTFINPFIYVLTNNVYMKSLKKTFQCLNKDPSTPETSNWTKLDTLPRRKVSNISNGSLITKSRLKKSSIISNQMNVWKVSGVSANWIINERIWFHLMPLCDKLS